MIRCLHCEQEENQVKVGFNRSGSQRYKCNDCNRKYTPEPNEQGYPLSLRQRAVEMYIDGINFRRIGRTLGVNHQSVINWVNAHVAQLPDEATVVAELDELFTFVGEKKRKRSS
jgi:transposase-like protein